jgi:hypothetical protein
VDPLTTASPENSKAEDVTLFRSTLNALGVFLLTFSLNIQGDSLYVLEKTQLSQDDNDFRSNSIKIPVIFGIFCIQTAKFGLGLRRSLCVKLFHIRRFLKQTS